MFWHKNRRKLIKEISIRHTDIIKFHENALSRDTGARVSVIHMIRETSISFANFGDLSVELDLLF